MSICINETKTSESLHKIVFTNSCLETNEKGQPINKNGKLLVNDLSSIRSTKEPIKCECCGRKWVYIRFKSDQIEGKYQIDPMRVNYVSELYNFIIQNGESKTDYKDLHQLMGRVFDSKISGMCSAQNKINEEKLNASSFTLWENGKVTDAFSFIRGIYAFNHDFGYIAHSCYHELLEEFDKKTLQNAGINGPKDLKLQFSKYDNNEKMIQWFEVAANHPKEFINI